MKDWRPEGWITPSGQWDWVDWQPSQIYEAGADAMLEVLKRRGRYVDSRHLAVISDGEEFPIVRTSEVLTEARGWLVFIKGVLEE